MKNPSRQTTGQLSRQLATTTPSLTTFLSYHPIGPCTDENTEEDTQPSQNQSYQFKGINLLDPLTKIKTTHSYYLTPNAIYEHSRQTFKKCSGARISIVKGFFHFPRLFEEYC